MDPGWLIFDDGCPGGETVDQVGVRMDRVIATVRDTPGNVVIFGHGHALRVFGARWLELPARAGRHFLLAPATVCVLTFYHAIPAIKRWNAPLVPLLPRTQQPTTPQQSEQVV
jgi:probable phosphoglycerate mutase